MKKKKHSILSDMHSRFLNLPYEFRTTVCAECQYSQATFYRKVRASLSEAEKDRIVSIAEGMLLDLQDVLNKHR